MTLLAEDDVLVAYLAFSGLCGGGFPPRRVRRSLTGSGFMICFSKRRIAPGRRRDVFRAASAPPNSLSGVAELPHLALAHATMV